MDTRLDLCLLWILSALLSAKCQEGCAFFYLAQPPRELPCNPYFDNSRFSLRLQCVVAVDRSVMGQVSDFQIRWFGQLGSESRPEELFLNDTFRVRIDQPTQMTTDFYVYQSQARIGNVDTGTLDRFWCQIDASQAFRSDNDITDLAKSDQTVINTKDYYNSPRLPVCTEQTFFHQTSLKCADGQIEANSTQSEPPETSSTSPDSLPSPRAPTSDCAPSNQDSAETSKLVSVLLPALFIPVVVAILLVVAAIIMTCRRRQKADKSGGKSRLEEAASMDNLSSPKRIPPPTTAAHTAETETALTQAQVQTERVPPTRPLLRSPIKIVNHPPSPPPPFVPPPASAGSAAARLPPPASAGSAAARPTPDIYEDVESVHEYSMSNNDIYSMTTDVTSVEREGHPLYMDPGRAHESGMASASHHLAKKGKRDENAHYKNAAMISISEKAAPMLVPTTTGSLPSLTDSKHYNKSASPRRQAKPKQPPTAAAEGLQKPGPDYYDSLVGEKSGPTYYNHSSESDPPHNNHPPVNSSSASLAMLVEDDEPDYDEVDDEAEPAPVSAYSTPTNPAAVATNRRKWFNGADKRSAASVPSEAYEDMSGMDEFIESFKSGAGNVA